MREHALPRADLRDDRQRLIDAVVPLGVLVGRVARVDERDRRGRSASQVAVGAGRPLVSKRNAADTPSCSMT
ncbi:MAG: hypothetical protein M5R40_12880 [Anaerolineae bacterium]|nr:hypothetical protein [Anaerolineae bacterium]